MASDISINLHHYIHFTDDEVRAKLDAIQALLVVMQGKEDTMSAELDALTVQVAANIQVEQSAITLIQGIAAQLTALKNDPAAITALADSLKSSADNLAAAITANTPAAP